MDRKCCTGSVAERSKALVLGTSLFGGVGSNPTAATGFELHTHISVSSQTQIANSLTLHLQIVGLWYCYMHPYNTLIILTEIYVY